jgi:hypothetical protein
VVNNNFLVIPEMFVWREAESALLKGMEVKLHPLKAGAYPPPKNENKEDVVYKYKFVY